MFTLSVVSSRAGMVLQDLIAPFHTFLRAEYELEYLKMDDDLSGSRAEIRSRASVRSGNRIRKSYEFLFTIENNRIEKISISTPKSNLEVRWDEVAS